MFGMQVDRAAIILLLAVITRHFFCGNLFPTIQPAVSEPAEDVHQVF